MTNLKTINNMNNDPFWLDDVRIVNCAWLMLQITLHCAYNKITNNGEWFCHIAHHAICNLTLKQHKQTKTIKSKLIVLKMSYNLVVYKC